MKNSIRVAWQLELSKDYQKCCMPGSCLRQMTWLTSLPRLSILMLQISVRRTSSSPQLIMLKLLTDFMFPFLLHNYSSLQWRENSCRLMRICTSFVSWYYRNIWSFILFFFNICGYCSSKQKSPLTITNLLLLLFKRKHKTTWFIYHNLRFVLQSYKLQIWVTMLLLKSIGLKIYRVKCCYKCAQSSHHKKKFVTMCGDRH